MTQTNGRSGLLRELLTVLNTKRAQLIQLFHVTSGRVEAGEQFLGSMLGELQAQLTTLRKGGALAARCKEVFKRDLSESELDAVLVLMQDTLGASQAQMTAQLSRWKTALPVLAGKQSAIEEEITEHGARLETEVAAEAAALKSEAEKIGTAVEVKVETVIHAVEADIGKVEKAASSEAGKIERGLLSLVGKEPKPVVLLHNDGSATIATPPEEMTINEAEFLRGSTPPPTPAPVSLPGDAAVVAPPVAVAPYADQPVTPPAT